MIESAASSSLPVSAIAASVNWIEALVIGSLASSVAVIAVAVLGLRMLGGRAPVASIFRVAMGCFILFGAPAIAAGIIGAARGGSGSPAANVPPETPDLSTRPPAYDPYAGAAMPVR